jgi:hypothetical protein
MFVCEVKFEQEGEAMQMQEKTYFVGEVAKATGLGDCQPNCR